MLRSASPFFIAGSCTRRTRGPMRGVCARRRKNAGLAIWLRRGSVALIALRAALHVEDVALAAVSGRHRDPGGGALRERILRDRAQVMLGDQLLERGRIAAGVGVMLVERIAHEHQV